jgi:hypothetical protein
MDERTHPVFAELTDDFVEAMKDDTSSAFAQLCGICGPPEGVDTDDPRVIAILKRLRGTQGE